MDWVRPPCSNGSAKLTRIDAYYAYSKIKSTIINYASTEEALKMDDWFHEGDGDVRYG